MANEKTKVISITNHRRTKNLKVEVGKLMVASKPAIKYLDLMFDAKLSFKKHLAHSATATFAKMLLNIGRPKQWRMLLLARVVHSILLYASPIWAEALSDSQRPNHIRRDNTGAGGQDLSRHYHIS